MQVRIPKAWLVIGGFVLYLLLVAMFDAITGDLMWPLSLQILLVVVGMVWGLACARLLFMLATNFLENMDEDEWFGRNRDT